VAVTFRAYRDGKLERESAFDPVAVEAARRDGARVWLDVVDPTEGELGALQRALGLHELAVEDTQHWGQRSKVEFYAEADHLFLVTHGLALDDRHELVDSEIHLFAGGGFYVATVRRAPLFDFAKTHDRLSSETHLSTEGIGHLLYLLLDEIVDGYLDTIDALEDLSDDVEDAVSTQEDGAAGEASKLLSQRIFRLRRQVVKFRRLAAPMRETVDLLLEDERIATPQLAPYYRDILDHVIRTVELCDNVRDLLTSVRELQLSQISNRLNVVMKQVTSWAAIILIPTLIAGIYGMNFRHMPELSWRLGYPTAIGSMVVAAFILYRVFKRRDWL
jgi:magnesium transporter